MNRRTLPAAAAAMLLAAALSGCMFREAEVEAPPPVQPIPEPQRVVHYVKQGRIAEEVNAAGRLVARREAQLFFGSGGRVRSVEVEAGAHVKPGQILASLENADLELNAELLDIELEKVRMRLEKAKAKAVPDEFEVRMLELDLRQAKLRRDQAHRRLAETRLIAPFAGQVMSADGNLRQGRSVGALQTMMVVADPSGVEVRSDMTETEAQLLEVGQKASIQLDGNQSAVLGEIVEIGAPEGGKRVVRLALTAQVPAAKLNSLVKVSITVRAVEHALILPNSAVREYEGKHFVQVLENGRKRQIDVEIGIRTSTETQIVKGLTEGQEVLGR